MKVFCTAKVISNLQIAPDIFDLTIYAPEIAKYASSGQFVNLYPKSKQTLLPRPISIAEIDISNGNIRLIYAVVGKGTFEFSKLTKDETIKAAGPLGNGFTIDSTLDKHIIVAGGIGVPPMIELAKNLNGNIKVFLGFKSIPILVDDFKKLNAEVYISTDDGNIGFKGNNIELLNNQSPTAQMMYACGPKPMLKAVSEWASQQNIPLQVSVEERMACGIGACVGCVCKTKVKNSDDWEYTKVCTNGPVFFSNEVIWND